MQNKKLTVYAIIIATYTAISILMGSFSFGMIQIRIAELLLVLCLYSKKYIIPITLGCFVTNLIGIINGLNPLIIDLFVGTLATFLSGICVYYFRNNKVFDKPLLSLFLPVLINGIIVGLELNLYFSINIFLLMIYVGVGEFISVTILGVILYKPIGKAVRKIAEWYNNFMNINIDSLGKIKEELHELKENQALLIDEDGKTSYAIVPIETFDKVEAFLNMLDSEEVPVDAKVKVIGPDSELSYEEYERIKTGIMEAVERTLKPKAEKLN